MPASRLSELSPRWVHYIFAMQRSVKYPSLIRNVAKNTEIEIKIGFFITLDSKSLIWPIISHNME